MYRLCISETTTGKKKKEVNPPRSLTELEYEELFSSVLNTVVDKDECKIFLMLNRTLFCTLNHFDKILFLSTYLFVKFS